jgi:serine kinase of HPr protein (carbohydrate metabolism regulator)
MAGSIPALTEREKMKVSDLIQEFNLKLFSGEKGIENEIAGGYVSDLLSDVMGFSKEGEVWVTLQTHQNVVAVASLKDLAAVVLVKGFEPEPETLIHSDNEGIPVLGTIMSTFEFSGKMYHLLKSR